MSDLYVGLQLEGGAQTTEDVNVFFHISAESQVIVLNRLGSAPDQSTTPPFTWWLTRFSLAGEFISTTAMTSVLGISGNSASFALCGTYLGDHIYVWTYQHDGGFGFQPDPVAGTNRISKISMLTGLEVATCQPDDDIFSQKQFSITPFTVGAVNYLCLIEDPPDDTNNICIINADTMTIVDTDDLGVTAAGQALVAGGAPDGTSRDLYLIYYDDGNEVRLKKINWSTIGGFTYTDVATLTGSDLNATWDDLWMVDGAVWDPSDGTIIAIIEGDSATDYAPLSYTYYHNRIVKLDPSDGSVVWTYVMRGAPYGFNYWANALERSDLSGGTLMISDYYNYIEIDTATGALVREKWNSLNQQGLAATSAWRGDLRTLICFVDNYDVQFLALAVLDTTTPSPWKGPPGGFCIFGGWHDPVEPYFYVLREEHGYEGYELVKISTATGEVVLRSRFDYDDANPFPGMPEVFDQESEVVGSPTGDRLWVWTSRFLGGGNYNIGIVEFDKATLALVDSHQLVWPHTDGSLAGDNLGGGTACSYDGRYVTRLGGGIGGLTNKSSMMSLYDSVSGGFSLIEFWDFPEFVLDNHIISRGHFFDQDGSFYVVAEPTDGVLNRQQGPCSIFKFSVTGGATPSLTYVEQHVITADDSVSYPTSNATLCMGASYRMDLNKVYVFFQKPFPTFIQPVVEIDLATFASTEVIADFPRGTDGPNIWDSGHNAWAPAGNFYLTTDESFLLPDTLLHILDVSSGAYVTYTIMETWGNSWFNGNSILESWSSSFSWYDPVNKTAGASGGTTTDDALGGAADVWVQFLVVEEDPCPPCEEDLEPCGGTTEPAIDGEWPDDLKPQSAGLHIIAATIGGGPSYGGLEEVDATGRAFWRFHFSRVRVRSRSDRRLWRKMEAVTAGRSGVVAIPIFDGKRAPWVTPGVTIDVEADTAFAAGATSGSLLANAAGTIRAGMHFSFNHRLYRIMDVISVTGSVYQVVISPPVRVLIPAGSALEFTRPTCRVRLKDDAAMILALRLLKHDEPDVDFEEDR